jgi:hypothetical protein
MKDTRKKLLLLTKLRVIPNLHLIVLRPCSFTRSLGMFSRSIIQIYVHFPNLDWGWCEYNKLAEKSPSKYNWIWWSNGGRPRGCFQSSKQTCLSHLFVVLMDQNESQSKDREDFFNRSSSDSESQYIVDCAAQVSHTNGGGSSLISIGLDEDSAAV